MNSGSGTVTRGSSPGLTHPLDRPKRCPKCDHIVKHEDKYQAHCDGCGILLRSVSIIPTDPYDPERQCYLCWRVSSAPCDWICTEAKTTATIEYIHRIKTETKQFTCQSGKHSKTESKVIGRTQVQPTTPPGPDTSTVYILMFVGLLVQPLGAISDQARTATEQQLGLLLYLVPLMFHCWACRELLWVSRQWRGKNRKAIAWGFGVLVLFVAMWVSGLCHLLSDYHWL